MKNHDYVTVIEYMIAVTEDIWHIEDWDIRHTKYVIDSILTCIGSEKDLLSVLGDHYYNYKNLVLDNIFINDILELISLDDINFILLYVFDTATFNKTLEDVDKNTIREKINRIKYAFNNLFIKTYTNFAIDNEIRQILSHKSLKITSEKVARVYLLFGISNIDIIVKSCYMYSEEYIDRLISTIVYEADNISNNDAMKNLLFNIYKILEIRNKHGKSEYSEYFISKYSEVFNQVINIATTLICNVEKTIK